jgi:hypothetical protein
MSQNPETEAKLLQQKYYGYPEELSKELIRLCLVKTDVVFFVFKILDWNSTYDVGFRFLRYIANAALLQLAQTTNGLVLCKQLYDWLMTSNVIGSYMPQIIKLRTAIESGEGEAAQRRQPRQLSSVEMSFYTNYNASPIATVSGDRKTFNPDICWLLPSEGTGFSVYNRDDLIIKKEQSSKTNMVTIKSGQKKPLKISSDSLKNGTLFTRKDYYKLVI